MIEKHITGRPDLKLPILVHCPSEKWFEKFCHLNYLEAYEDAILLMEEQDLFYYVNAAKGSSAPLVKFWDEGPLDYTSRVLERELERDLASGRLVLINNLVTLPF